MLQSWGGNKFAPAPVASFLVGPASAAFPSAAERDPSSTAVSAGLDLFMAGRPHMSFHVLSSGGPCLGTFHVLSYRIARTSQGELLAGPAELSQTLVQRARPTKGSDAWAASMEHAHPSSATVQVLHSALAV